MIAGDVRIKDLPDADRPRERLARDGPDGLSNVDLIAILLRSGMKGRSVIRVAEDLISRFGSLHDLARASLNELEQTSGVGRDKAVTLKSAFTLARRMARELGREAPLLDTPERVAALIREESRLCEVEHFFVVLLNARRRLIRMVAIAQGTLDTAVVHPREVFRQAILSNAASIVLAHNHPSGDPSPSDADIKVTRDLVRAGRLMKIEVVDHLIFGSRTETRPRDYLSLRELGYFYS